ncbi:MAG: hypothetical protein O2999_12795 [Nitrospirae bacterium]|nr:hypothetical protein [Nitrospirota bacterium]MDA1305152.1 hypothetical protein [Nitrospirota bacterium]
MKQPKNTFHSGEMLIEGLLEQVGIKQSQFAQKIECPRTRVNKFSAVSRLMQP